MSQPPISEPPSSKPSISKHRAAVLAAVGLAGAMTAATITASTAGAAASDQRVDGRSDFNVTGLTADGRLVEFETRYPKDVEVIGTVSGLTGDTSLVGMDYRVQDGELYAVGNAGGVYTVDADDASVTKVSQLGVGLVGSSFGVDFNPAADRLRVISDTGQNLRHDVTSGTTVNDGPLTYPAVPPGDPTPGVGITGAAYTNNDLDPATGTTLFVLDSLLDQVVIQSPANAGLLAATGKTGVDAGPQVGFDLYSKIRKGRAVDVTGFAVLQVDGRSRGYGVDPLSGAVKELRTFPGSMTIVDVAMPLDQR